MEWWMHVMSFFCQGILEGKLLMSTQWVTHSALCRHHIALHCFNIFKHCSEIDNKNIFVVNIWSGRDRPGLVFKTILHIRRRIRSWTQRTLNTFWKPCNFHCKLDVGTHGSPSFTIDTREEAKCARFTCLHQSCENIEFYCTAGQEGCTNRATRFISTYRGAWPKALEKLHQHLSLEFIVPWYHACAHSKLRGFLDFTVFSTLPSEATSLQTSCETWQQVDPCYHWHVT